MSISGWMGKIGRQFGAVRSSKDQDLFLSCSVLLEYCLHVQGKAGSLIPHHIHVPVARRKKGKVEGMKLILRQGLSFSAFLTYGA